MFTNSGSTNIDEKFMINVDVEGKTKQKKIGDIINKMDNQEEDQKYINENVYFNYENNNIRNDIPENNRKDLYENNRKDLHENNRNDLYQNEVYPINSKLNKDNEMNFKKSLKNQFINSLDSDDRKYNLSNIELDLSVPTSFNNKINMSVSRGMGSFLVKSPDFFKKVNKQDCDILTKNIQNTRFEYENSPPNENFNRENYNTENLHIDKNIYSENLHIDKNIYSENDFTDQNRFYKNLSTSQGSPNSFNFQTDLFNQFPNENNHDSFYNPKNHNSYLGQPDINSQSNNLFGHQFMNFNKKRSYSEADLNKPSRNPFLNLRRSSQFSDDFYKKASRSVSDTCIDPRMFYKNIGNQITNKENHTKPAFSYAQIITRALNGSPDGKLTLGEIYKWIEDNFEYYKYANPVWKNSIRHNLSLSKCFKKVAREPGTRGKGGKWMVDKEFLIQEENRKKRRTFEEENMHNNSYGIDPNDSKYYQM